MKLTVITSLYFLVGALNLLAQITASSALNIYTKPLLMPLLIYIVYLRVAGTVTLPRLLLAGALIFSWAGDLFLMYGHESSYFLGGLGAFLIAQILYILILNKSVDQKQVFLIKPLIPVILYGILLLSVLIPNAGNLVMPIVLYAVCLLGMVGSALLRQGRTIKESFKWALIGAILFVLSDSLIAMDKFVLDLPYGSSFVMTTYILAQYYLVKGILLHPEPSNGQSA